MKDNKVRSAEEGTSWIPATTHPVFLSLLNLAAAAAALLFPLKEVDEVAGSRSFSSQRSYQQPSLFLCCSLSQNKIAIWNSENVRVINNWNVETEL
ncbi:hypothetical protein V2J09_022855 [Rumex salicifolius]